MSAPERTPRSQPEQLNPGLVELIKLRDELVGSVREFSRSQVGLWRQVPEVALRAYGRAGSFEKYKEAYKNGYWILDRAPNGLSHSVRTGVVVDLETGELFDEASTYNFQDDEREPIPAEASGILKALAVPEQLDAQIVLEELRENAKKPIRESYSKDDTMNF